MASAAKKLVTPVNNKLEASTVKPSVVRNAKPKPAPARRAQLTVVTSNKVNSQLAAAQAAALNKSRTATFICDLDWEITFANEKSFELLESLEAGLKAHSNQWRSFRASDVVGASVDFLFTDEPHEFDRVCDSRNLPYSRNVQLGSFICEVFIDEIQADNGTVTGYIVEWAEVTKQVSELTINQQLINALENCTTNVMLADPDLKLTYANKALRENLKKWEPDFQAVFGASFKADDLLGRCIDDFHKNPAHQRKLLANESMFPMQTMISVGPLRIELAVNVLKGSKGETLGYSTEWIDVTERLKADDDYKAKVKEISERMEFLRGACATDLADAMEALSNGDLTFTITPRTPLLDIPQQPDLALMAETFNALRNQTVKSVEAYMRAQEGLSLLVGEAEGKAEKISNALDALANGDLTFDIGIKSSGLTTEVLKATTFNNLRAQTTKSMEAFDRAQDGLSSLVGQARLTAESILEASTEVMTGNDDLAQRTEEQAASLEETASSMEEMTSTVKQNADNAKQANQLAMQARESAEKGGQVVNDAVSTMKEINVASKRIADIISVIDEIAFQTNLLALNAAVEAARVGEQGRGFAVVAAEVRNLAGRSATAAKEIKGLVQDSVQKVQEGSGLVNQSGTQLEEIVTSVKKVADIIAEIAAAAQEQSVGIEQVNKAITEMDQITQQNAALVEEASATSQSMNRQASDLQSVIKEFKIDASLVAELEAKLQAEHAAAVGVAQKAAARIEKSDSSGRRPVAKAAPVKKATRVDLDNFEEF